MAEEPATSGLEATDNPLNLGEEVHAVARGVREILDGWVERMAGSAAAGRSATTVARMATARAAAELRHLNLPDEQDPASTTVADYLRRARSTVAQAAHEIERNRYSLHAMHTQVERLEALARPIFGEKDGEGAAEEPGTADESDGAAGGTDDRRADR